MKINERIDEISPAPWVVNVVIGAFAVAGGLGLGYILGKRRKVRKVATEQFLQTWDISSDDLQAMADIARDLEHMKKEGNEGGDKPPSTPGQFVIDEEAYYHLHPVEEEGRLVAVYDGGTMEEVPVAVHMAEVVARDGTEGFNQEEEPDPDDDDEPYPRADITEFMEPYPKQPPERPNVTLPPVDRNIFAADPVEQGWDYQYEIARRSPDKPYVLHRDEFFANEMDFTQNVYIYYAGDAVLVDEAYEIVANPARLVGEHVRFGHGSGDDSVVYIRNEKRRSEFEINLNLGTYAETQGVYPEDDEIEEVRHSSVPKFRQER